MVLWDSAGPEACTITRELALPCCHGRVMNLKRYESHGLMGATLTIEENGRLRGTAVVSPSCPPSLSAQMCILDSSGDEAWLLPEPLRPAAQSEWVARASGKFYAFDVSHAGKANVADCGVDYRIYFGNTPRRAIESLVISDESPLENPELFMDWMEKETLTAVAIHESDPIALAAMCMSPYPALSYIRTDPKWTGKGIATNALRQLAAEASIRTGKPPYAMSFDRLLHFYEGAGFKQKGGWKLWTPRN